MTALDKMLTLDRALEAAASLRASGKKIAALSGTFDLMHGGHIAIIEEARREADALVVFVNSDASVRLYKGPSRPYVSERDRALVLASLDAVAFVVIFDGLNAIPLIERLKPDVYVNGSDWGENSIERPTVEAYGGKICVVKRGVVSSASSSEIIERIYKERRIAPIKAVFVDRDGVILEDVEYLYEVEKAKFLPKAIEGLRALQEAHYNIVVVTNQSGIGQGKFTESAMHAINGWMEAELKKNGITILEIYFCPHVPKDACECRKPKTELLARAARKHGIVLEKSWFIGDKWSDIECGRFANARAILIENNQYKYKSPILPNYRVKDLIEAARIIQKN